MTKFRVTIERSAVQWVSFDVEAADEEAAEAMANQVIRKNKIWSMPAIRNAFVEEDEADWHYIDVREKEEDDQPLSRIDNPTDPCFRTEAILRPEP